MATRTIPAILIGSCLLAFPFISSAQPGDPKTLFEEAGKAFTAKNYKTAVAKIQQLLPHLPDPADPGRELLLFNLGLAHMLDGNFVEAEKAFSVSAAAFPNGEYTSRAYLGIGQSAMRQGGAEKQDVAIKAFRRAAADPKYRAEAGLSLGILYSETGKNAEALQVFRSLMGSDVRTPAQTAASVEAVDLLANSGQIENLVGYMDRLINQEGVRDAITWFVNQVIVKGDEIIESKGNYAAALAIFRSIPPREQILAIQAEQIAERKSELGLLKENVGKLDAKDEKLAGRIQAINELIDSYEGLLKQVEEATKAIENLKNLDAMLLMRRGRCFFYLDRKEEALLCFSTLREKYPASEDAQSAAFAEIVIHHELKNIDKLQSLGEAYLQKYPEASNGEQVASLVGELLAASNDWPRVLSFFQDMEQKYSNSASLDRFVFFQGVAMFQNGDFKNSAVLFEKFIKNHPQSQLQEAAVYRVAMAYFLTNDYGKTLAWCKEYLTRFPDGQWAGDILYRLAFIDSQDKEADQSEKIVKSLNEYLEKKPADPAAGPMFNLLGDTLQKIKSGNEAVLKANEDKALDAYRSAVWASKADEVIQYGMESATTILQKRKDWQGMADLHNRFINERPDHPMALLSVNWVAKAMQRLDKPEEGAKLLADVMAKNIADPASEQVEHLISEIVKNLVPRRRPKDFDPKPLEKQIVDLLSNAAKGKENATTHARINFARAQLYDQLKNREQSDFYLKVIASDDNIDPAALSPMLLSVCGEILVKENKLDRAEKMFQRLADRYKDSVFSDAGPVGLGQIALARKQPEKALKIFDDALSKNTGTSRFTEATIGKLIALRDLGKFDEAEKLALQVAADKSFRGAPTAQAYLVLGDALVLKSKKQTPADGLESVKKAHGYYQRVYLAYQREAELCAEAYFKAYETLKVIGNQEVAKETLKQLIEHPKLQNTEYWKKAQPLKYEIE
ncbi:MAG: tetratricopeptide repeat protein [Verrucomicrobiota bacterium]